MTSIKLLFIISGNTVRDRQENATVNKGTGDQEFTVGASDENLMTSKNMVNVKTLEGCFIDMIDREINNIVDKVEDTIQNANLTAVDSIVALKIEFSIRSINASSARDATSVTANWERGDT